MSKINVLKSVVAPLTQLMSARGVSVSFVGDQACTTYDKEGNPTKIILPVINESAGDEIIDVFHGYIDHEVAHVIHTDLKTNELNEKLKKNKIVAIIFNCVEDPRVEVEICKQFKGCAHNLNNLYRKVFAESYVKDLAPQNTPEGMFGRLILATRALAGQSYFTNLEKMADGSIKQTIIDNFGENCIRNLKNSEEAYELALKIVNLFELQACGANGKGEGEIDNDGDGKGGDTEGEVNGQEKDDKSNGKSKQDEDSQDGDSKKEATDTAGKGEKQDADSNDSNKANSSWDDIEDPIHKVIKKIAEQAFEKNEYVVYTTDNDKIEFISENETDHIGDDLDNISSAVGTIQKSFERAMNARSIINWMSGQRRGKIQTSALYRLRLKDDRIFKRQILTGDTKDTAVSLVLDCSGSMDGRKAIIAAQSAFILSKVLTNLGIKHEIIGFTTIRHDYQGSQYARVAPLYIPIFKSFNESLTIKTRLRLSRLYNDRSTRNWMWNNVDGESVQIAGERLLSRPEKRKIMLVLSDGMPNADGNDMMLNTHVVETIKELEKKIEVVGIGIYSDSVRHFYSHYCVLNSVEELPGTIIKEVQNFLIPKK